MVWRLKKWPGYAAAGVLLTASLILGAGPAIPQTSSQTSSRATSPVSSGASLPPEAELHPFIPPKAAEPVTSRAAAPSHIARPPAPKPAAPKPTGPKPEPRPAAPATAAPPAHPVPYLATTTPASQAAPRPAAPHAPAPAKAAANPASTSPAATPISADDIETFTDSVVRTLMQRDHVLGAEVAVVQGNTPLLIKGYGYDRLNPARRVDPDSSLFRLGSISKVFTWVVARQEIEAGRINPNASIGDYLPDDLYNEDRRYKPITLNNLMDHTPGFEDTSLGHLFTLDPARLEGVDSYFRIHRPRRVRQPGQFSSYSNYGTALAARALVQTAHAKDVPTLMEARVFAPLGMDHTTLREPYPADGLDADDLPAPLSPALTQALSDGFIWDGASYAPQPFDHAIALSGALGASSTAQDMAKFMSLMLDGGQTGNGPDGIQLYNAASAKAFRTPMLNMPEGYNGWASGLMIRQSPSGFTTYGHGGATLWFNANMILVPQLNLGIFIATNTQTGGALTASFPNLLLDHLNGDIVKPPLMPAPDMAYANHRDYDRAITGQYVSSRRAYGGLEGAVTRLINTVAVSIDRDGRLVLSTPNGQSAFVPASAPGFYVQQDAEDPGPASDTGGLHFLFNAAGTHVTAFETASNLARYERVGWVHSPQVLGWLTIVMVMSCVVTLLSLARTPARHEHPTAAQNRATFLSVGLAIIWLVALFIFHSWRAGLTDDPGSLFTRWPSGSVRLASALAFFAALATLYQAATFYFVVSENGRHGDGWPVWQKIAHGLLVGWWLFYSVVLMLWGALEPWSW
ncbi:serine hydrolase domain-containing protein [Asticcacaulis sp. EMRT-3]|uniref:serine hydrolase domain-containing protein n=1 Tax=Asticcacaulis sp. EMRT-3 TaxID=3040349 RepID=UPI0024AF256A|nr:serine hydrolase domain-containing protein [Asticcacaulis sp. EMRT-3]MDI7775255.1 serine hydrolase domain-containing protein [Asticcacaulis sp. EMRT-3]